MCVRACVRASMCARVCAYLRVCVHGHYPQARLKLVVYAYPCSGVVYIRRRRRASLRVQLAACQSRHVGSHPLPAYKNVINTMLVLFLQHYNPDWK